MFRIQDDDSFWGADQKTSTRFDHNFSITDFLKINLGTQVALRLVSSVAHALQYCCFGSKLGNRGQLFIVCLYVRVEFAEKTQLLT